MEHYAGSMVFPARPIQMRRRRRAKCRKYALEAAFLSLNRLLASTLEAKSPVSRADIESLSLSYFPNPETLSQRTVATDSMTGLSKRRVAPFVSWRWG